MKRILSLLLLFTIFVGATAQDRGRWSQYVNRLEAFGKSIPQEKVYIHMDNTCYFLGDTIWFKAYLRQTNTDRPSQFSGTLYVELFNNDGYLMRRKLIEMKNGEGDGYFHLPADSSMYSGYYELRAYTRWQLNWHETTHPHDAVCKDWFFNSTMYREFFRDYEKLYSRVFPVYNKPYSEGAYYLDMTMRPLQRFYKPKSNLPKLNVQFFPEGGNLVAGVPNRVAYEITSIDGEAIAARSTTSGVSTSTQHRGRGVLEISPELGSQFPITFETDSGQIVQAKLPKPEAKGVAMQVMNEGDKWLIQTHAAGLSVDSLALTIMHEGRLVQFTALSAMANGRLEMADDALPIGVNQVTIFDTEGHVWADRLFFVTRQTEMQPTLQINPLKGKYEAFERIDVDVQSARQASGNVSVSVRDVSRGSQNYDTGNILAEMLLASEIRGFVPDPAYYFEANDEEHRVALDLLMMTQGWRRFNWREMAVKGEWEFVHPAEKTPFLTGAVHNLAEYDIDSDDEVVSQFVSDFDEATVQAEEGPEVLIVPLADITRPSSRRGEWKWKGKELKKNERADTLGVTKEMRERMELDGEKSRREVRVHAEFQQDGSENFVIGDVTTKDRRFQFTQPRFEGECVLFLAASDTTKWPREERLGKKSHFWRLIGKESRQFGGLREPEYYVRLSYPYPHYVKPYNYYQTLTRPLNLSIDDEAELEDDVYKLGLVTVKHRRKGLTQFRFARPATRFDAYDALNHVVDAGFMQGYCEKSIFPNAIARYLVGDMGMGAYRLKPRYVRQAKWGDYDDLLFGRYDQVTDKRGEEKAESMDGLGLALNELDTYFPFEFYDMDSIFVFSDYAPRLEGDPRYAGANQPDVDVVVTLYDDGVERQVLRDRVIRLQGFAEPAEFYSPDYSKKPLPEVKDYRRTLYWNPNLKLDNEGKARITLYNNSNQSIIQVDAQGQASDGTLLFTPQ